MTVCAKCSGYGYARGGSCWNCKGSGSEPDAAEDGLAVRAALKSICSIAKQAEAYHFTLGASKTFAEIEAIALDALASAHEGGGAAVWIKPEHLRRLLDSDDPLDGAMVWAEQLQPDFVPLADYPCGAPDRPHR